MDAYSLFEILVREHASMLTTYIRSLVYDPGAIDDIWQETMIVAWNRLDDFDRERPFGPWLRGIAARVILAKKRLAARSIFIGDAATLERLDGQFDRFQHLHGDTFDDKLEALRDCVAKLSDSDRQCIHLRYQEDVKPSDMSQRLGLALENVKKKLFRAKKQLLVCLEAKMRAQEAAS